MPRSLERSYVQPMTAPLVREARNGDGAALAALHLDVAEYYLQLQPDDFRMPDSQGLSDHFEPSSQPANPDRLWIVAEIEGQVAGSLIAYLQHPAPGARFDQHSQPICISITLPCCARISVAGSRRALY